MAPTPAQAREAGKRGGRPTGSRGALTKITEHKARELAANNETPLDVMIDNMNFWRKRASELTDTMQDQLALISRLELKSEDQQRVFIDEMKKFNNYAEHMIAAREQAQSCAVDAAPYVHPRFQSVAIKQVHDNSLIDLSPSVDSARVPITKVLELVAEETKSANGSGRHTNGNGTEGRERDFDFSDE